MTENEIADAAREVEAPESWLLTLSREFGSAVRLGKSGIDLLADAACGAASTTKTITQKIAKRARRDLSLSSSEETLFEELGSKVVECPGGDYLSLKNDLEFWELVKGLHSIRGKVAKMAIAEQESQQEETAESAPQSPESDEAIPEVTAEQGDASEEG